MTFNGFTLPDGAWIPPELIYLLPHIGEAKLKVLLAVIYHNAQIGGAEALSLADISRITGLSRQSVVSALKELVDQDGLMERRALGRSFVYTPRVKILDSSREIVQNLDYPSWSKVVQNLDSSRQLRESESLNLSKFNLLTDSTAADGQKFRLFVDRVTKLRAAGVYLKTAQGLAARCDDETLERHLDYYRHALSLNLAQGPGWLVQSLKEDWPAPLGYVARSGEIPDDEDSAPGDEPVDHPSDELAGEAHEGLIWMKMREELQERVSPAYFERYVSRCSGHYDGPVGIFYLRAPDKETAEWLTDRVQKVIERWLAGAVGEESTVVIGGPDGSVGEEAE